MLELNAWNRGMRLFLVLCCALLVSWSLYAQQPLQTSEGRVVGTKIMVSTQAPYCILFPDETRHGNELITLARKINNLGANVLLVPSVTPYLSSKTSADSLVADMGGALPSCVNTRHSLSFCLPSIGWRRRRSLQQPNILPLRALSPSRQGSISRGRTMSRVRFRCSVYPFWRSLQRRSVRQSRGYLPQCRVIS